MRTCCAGCAAGTQNALPLKSAKRPPVPVTFFQFWAQRNGLVLLKRRREQGLFGGMWELPGFTEEGHAERADPVRLAERCEALLGPGWRPGGELARVERTLTHRRILFVVHEAHGETPAGEELLWASEQETAALALSSAQRAAWRAVREGLKNASAPQGALPKCSSR